MKKEEKKKVKKEQSNLISLLELISIIIFIAVVLIFFKNTTVWNIVILLLILTVLVFVHEGGHFLAAKKFGVHVYEFAIGMGPKVLGFKRKGDPTEYTIRAFPIGGFCQMAGEDIEDDPDLKKDQFMCNKGKLQRAIILCAGVFMNFVLAFVTLFFLSLIWGSPEQRSYVSSVIPNSSAERAGIKSGDFIIELNNHSVKTTDELSLVSMLKNDAKTYKYVVRHQDGSESKYDLVLEDYIVVNDKGDVVKIDDENTKEKIIEDYKLDKDTEVTKLVGLQYDQTRKHGLINAIKYAHTKFWSLIRSMILVIWSLITGALGLSSLSGPVGMYSVVKTVAVTGIANIIYLAAYLSINLGVLNILPIPAMDGGRLLFVIIEAITRKKVDPKFENTFHNIGFFLLMGLMLYITYRDILKLF